VKTVGSSARSPCSASLMYVPGQPSDPCRCITDPVSSSRVNAQVIVLHKWQKHILYIFWSWTETCGSSRQMILLVSRFLYSTSDHYYMIYLSICLSTQIDSLFGLSGCIFIFYIYINQTKSTQQNDGYHIIKTCIKTKSMQQNDDKLIYRYI
jgi:hypothetical protein